MFTNNKFGKLDAVADAIKSIAEADYKSKMEELKGQQHKIDKNKNNKIDAHDFKILRGEKRINEEEVEIEEGTESKADYHDRMHRLAAHYNSMSDEKKASLGKIPGRAEQFMQAVKYAKDNPNMKKEEVEESNNPFDVKNYKSQLPTKPGEKAGFDSKKISTGTVYSRKPVKDEPMKKEEIDPNDTTTDTLKGRDKTSGNKFLSKKVKMDVPDNVKEEAEQIDELKKTTVKSYLAKKMASLPGKDPKKDQKDMMKAHHRVTGVKPTSEEVEQIDEGSMDKATLTTLWKKHANHTFTKDNYKDAYTSGTDSAHHAHNAATAIENHVRKKYGNKVADDMVNHSEHSSAATDTHPNSKEREYHDSSAEKLRQKHKVGHVSLTEEVEERTLTPGEKSEKERIVKGMKKSLKGFKARYGDKAKSVMYATATARAKK